MPRPVTAGHLHEGALVRITGRMLDASLHEDCEVYPEDLGLIPGWGTVHTNRVYDSRTVQLVVEGAIGSQYVRLPSLFMVEVADA